MVLDNQLLVALLEKGGWPSWSPHIPPNLNCSVILLS